MEKDYLVDNIDTASLMFSMKFVDSEYCRNTAELFYLLFTFHISQYLTKTVQKGIIASQQKGGIITSQICLEFCFCIFQLHIWYKLSSWILGWTLFLLHSHRYNLATSNKGCSTSMTSLLCEMRKERFNMYPEFPGKSTVTAVLLLSQSVSKFTKFYKGMNSCSWKMC